MRDAVTATILPFKELDEERAAELGCLSVLLCMQLAGRLQRKDYLCQAAARSGQLDKLKLLRAGGCLWDELTCSQAIWGGLFDVLQCARSNGCPCDVDMCTMRGGGIHGHEDIVKWLRTFKVNKAIYGN